MKRKNLVYLNAWLKRSKRKPLVLRGARQVGKSFLVRDFAARNNLQLIEINFEFSPDIISLFLSKDIQRIKFLVQTQFGKKLNADSLLFLDEIQVAPEVFSVLRFFYESQVDFPIIAAGSLLEFAMEDKKFSMPVGRLEYHYLGPITFEEFLSGVGEHDVLSFLNSYRLAEEVPIVLHNKIVELFSVYLSLGGMPEVIQTFIEEKDFQNINHLKSSLINTYEDDFHKYKKRIPWERIRKVFRSIPFQLGNKFKYSNVSSEERAQALGDALDLLCQAQVAYKVFHSQANGIPLGSQVREKYFKVLFLDFGLSAFLLGMKSVVNLSDWNSSFKGALFDQIVGQHLLYLNDPYIKPELCMWAREKAQSSAEIDYLFEQAGTIVPIEVKSGSTGHLRSMHLFLDEKKLAKGVRFNLERPSVFEGSSQIISLPIYFVEQLKRLLKEA